MEPNPFLKERSGIYGIRNTMNNKLYIGRTQCMYKRCHQYVYDFKNRSIGHINDYLYNAMKKVGIDKFQFFPIQFEVNEHLPDLELYWMIHYNTCDPNFGYNLRQDVGAVYKIHPETSLKISNNLKKQWADGIRNGHSEKLKQSWKTRDREKQSKLFSVSKTKYSYTLTKDGRTETCDYKRLVELKLQNCMANFHRSKIMNLCNHKGYTITRYPKGECPT